MHILLVKTSSLGDVIHALPAISDAQKYCADFKLDWVVEESYSDIASWHPAVNKVISVNVRQWRKHPWRTWRNGEWQHFKTDIGQHYYDYVIDAQGLIKSALLALQARGKRCGLDKRSAREPLASLSYQQGFYVEKNQHAVERVRYLFAQALGYSHPQTAPDYGIQHFSMTTLMPSRPTLIFLHGTTWPSKHWPESYWQALALMAVKAGFRVRLPWGNESEKARATRLAYAHPDIIRMPATNLTSLAAEITTAKGVVGVDTGLSHLATALNVPTVSIYGSTSTRLTGTYGGQQTALQARFDCAPCIQRECHYKGASKVTPACYETLPPKKVWQTLMQKIETLSF